MTAGDPLLCALVARLVGQCLDAVVQHVPTTVDASRADPETEVFAGRNQCEFRPLGYQSQRESLS